MIFMNEDLIEICYIHKSTLLRTINTQEKG